MHMDDGYGAPPARDVGANPHTSNRDTLLFSDREHAEPGRRPSRSPLANLSAFLNRTMKKRKK
jgi:hypothetical protein